MKGFKSYVFSRIMTCKFVLIARFVSNVQKVCMVNARMLVFLECSATANNQFSLRFLQRGKDFLGKGNKVVSYK